MNDVLGLNGYNIPNNTSYVNAATLSPTDLTFIYGGTASTYALGTASKVSSSYGTLTFQVSDPYRTGTMAAAPKFNSILGVTSHGINVTGDINLSGSLVTPVKSFPDFVFSPDYNLASLDQVDAYIQQHHHLPDVPSADDVSKSGLDLVQMNTILLRKVEELTLHAIAQQKEIDALKANQR